MSKAVLVLDMPESCDMCDLIEMVNGKMYCGVKGCGQCAEDYIVCRPDWCPLREIPQKIGIEEALKMERAGCIADVINSYNACIDEIMKGGV